MAESNDLVTIESDDDILELREAKARAIQFSSPNSYVRSRVFKYRDIWWKKWKEMLNSEDDDLKKLAIIEFNKLQARVLPTQLEGGDGKEVTVNVMNYSNHNNDLKNKKD